MKKILIIINNLGFGGAERLVIDDINEMLVRGIDVTLITLKPEKDGRSLSAQCKISPEKWISMDFGSLLNLKSWVVLIRKIMAIKPYAMVTHLWYSNLIGRVVGKICGIEVVVIFEHNVYDTLKTKKMFLIDRVLQGLPKYIVAVSTAVESSLLRHRINGKKIKVIHNGIDISKYNKKSNRDIKKELGLEKECVYIFVGRLIQQKGVDVLIRAFGQTNSPHLLVVGDGVEKNRLIALSKEVNVDGRVHFLGIREDISDLLCGSDCFVLPSRYEGLPMVLLEAIAARKMIITSNFQSATELITNNKNGLIVKIEDVGGLALALNRVFDEVTTGKRSIRISDDDVGDINIQRHVDKLVGLLK